MINNKVLVCTIGFYRLLTYNKEYDCIRETPCGYIVKLDSGNITQVSKERFKVKK